MQESAAMIRWTKIRERAAAITAVLVLVVMIALAAVVFEVHIPILSDITNAMGLGRN